MTTMPLSYLENILKNAKPNDDEDIIITTDGNDIVVEEPKTKAKPKKAKAKQKANREENK